MPRLVASSVENQGPTNNGQSLFLHMPRTPRIPTEDPIAHATSVAAIVRITKSSLRLVNRIPRRSDGVKPSTAFTV